MPYGTVNADLMTTSDGVSSSGLYGFKNRIINGAMVIDQRNAGASVTPTGNGYTLDRYRVEISQSSKFSVQQNAGSVTPPTGFTKYLGITSLSAYSISSTDYFVVKQSIEGNNIADLGWGASGASAVTLSFKVYSSLTGTFGGVIQNADATRSYPFTYTISSANTWTSISITIAGDTTGTWQTGTSAGIIVYYGFGVGSTYSGTAGAWASANYISATGATSVVGTNGATFYITGVQLEKGSTATSFDYRPYGTELALCQRYYYSIGGENVYQTAGVGQAYTTTNLNSIVVPFPVNMRTIPTFSYNALVNWFFQNAAGSGLTPTAITQDAQEGSSKMGNLRGTVASGLVAGNATCLAANNSLIARLNWSAEL
jgi:hypothetical protein